MENNLDKFDIEERILYDEISQDKLTYAQARKRCIKLWKLIPTDTDVNPVRLNILMKTKFGNDPDWNKYSKTFKINVGSICDESIEEYMNKVIDGLKKKKNNG